MHVEQVNGAGSTRLVEVSPAAATGPSAEQLRPAPAAANDAELLGRALGGDDPAMRSLIDRLHPTVCTRVRLALLRRRGQARGRDLGAEVEDLSQEVFAALFEQEGRVLRDWEPERGLSLKGFVRLVAERTAGAILRTGKRNPFTEEPTADDTLRHIARQNRAGQASATDLIEARDLLEAVIDRLCERLTPQGLRLFELIYVDECSVAEACSVTRLTPDALYAWRSRIGKLAREVRAELTDGPRRANESSLAGAASPPVFRRRARW